MDGDNVEDCLHGTGGEFICWMNAEKEVKRITSTTRFIWFAKPTSEYSNERDQAKNAWSPFCCICEKHAKEKEVF